MLLCVISLNAIVRGVAQGDYVQDVLHGSVRAKVSAAIAGDTLNEVNNDPVQRNKLVRL